MADSLRRQVNTSSFSVMQDKLESWYKDYHVISCDQNLNKCSELVELTSKIQGQLFTILNLTAREGGHYAGVDVLKSRLLPWLGTCFSMATSVTNNTSLNLIQESVEKEWKIRALSATHENDMQKMDTQLCSTRLQLESLKQELVRSRSPSPLPRRSHHSSPLRSESPTRAQLNNSSRHARLVSRFSDLYAVERLEAQSLLRRYIDNLQMVQIIIFIATVEAFQAAKLAYRQFKLCVRKTLSPSHLGPEILEESVVDYIVRNLDLYDVQASINDVINAMNVNPLISFPPEVDFVLISSFIRETCRVAFAMQTLDSPLDLAFTSDPELYSDNNYDSEFTAPLVEGDSVLVKGEAVTRRGALWRSRSRSYSPARSHSGSPTRTLVNLGIGGGHPVWQMIPLTMWFWFVHDVGGCSMLFHVPAGVWRPSRDRPTGNIPNKLLRCTV